MDCKHCLLLLPSGQVTPHHVDDVTLLLVDFFRSALFYSKAIVTNIYMLFFSFLLFLNFT